MNIKKELFGYIKIIVAGIVIALILNKVVIINSNVTSESMVPTLNKDDKLIGFRLAYLFSEPERGDIVVFKYPDDESKLFVKRVIGLPGETVKIEAGKVYVAGSDGEFGAALDEPYLNETPTGDFGPYLIPSGCYFVLGDNREHSGDSRYWRNTYVTEDELIAKIIFRYKGGFGVIR